MTKIFKKSQFDNSVAFKPSLTSDDVSMQALAVDLMETMENELGLSFRRQRDLYVMNLTTILCNFLHASTKGKETWLAYPRSEGDPIYRASSRYNVTKLSYSRVVKLMDGLVDLGMVEYQRGFNDRREGGSSRISRAIPTDTLRDRMSDYAVDLGRIHRKIETIVLRDRNGKDVEYTDTPAIRAMKATLERINGMLATVDVAIGCTARELGEVMQAIKDHNRWLLPEEHVQLDFTFTALYRVFNNEIRSKPRLTHGGRFYGHWVQSVPSRHRARITIDGKPTCELDYSGLHINMLYARAGLLLPEGDVYEVDGVNLYRDAMKGILQCLINADSREQAMAAIIDAHDDNPFIGADELEQAARAFEAKHEAIGQYFGTGIGSELQRIDADMAERVMLELLDNGIVCLPIHDSFIVQADHVDYLREAMTNASKAVLGIELEVSRKH